MAKEPSQVREEIERTRRELGETIEALARIDVKAQATHKAQELRSVATARAQAKVAEVKPVLTARVRERVAELRPVLAARVRDKVAELRPVVIARANQKRAELRAAAEVKGRETLVLARHSVVDAARQRVRGVFTIVSDKPKPLVVGGGAGLLGTLVLARRLVRWRRRRRLARRLKRGLR